MNALLRLATDGGAALARLPWHLIKRIVAKVMGPAPSVRTRRLCVRTACFEVSAEEIVRYHDPEN